ncbi:unnamed protein product [Blepharisma stoltei]|uniref:Uncharacterized protein n=1 Tax=Blepharisma stoltei TaxID=1481888 RepID=A0AAU9I884_9CILI|nr:unnamed protein product [Blepharisma stoltei]
MSFILELIYLYNCLSIPNIQTDIRGDFILLKFQIIDIYFNWNNHGTYLAYINFTFWYNINISSRLEIFDMISNFGQ